MELSKIRACKLEWSKRNPDKRSAHFQVQNELRRGRIKKSPCEKCGALKVQAHHDDYSAPLNIRWLCAPHHKEAHGFKLRPKTKTPRNATKKATLYTEAVSLHSQGLSYSKIATILGVTKGYAFKIINRPPYQ